MNRLKELRLRNNLTQEELGKLLNVQKAAISKYENGVVDLTEETIKKLTEIFNVTSDYIIGISNDEEKPRKYNNEIDTLAAHFEGKNLTPKKRKLIEKYIDALFEDDEE
ncbi:helix-turn-helix domain-containing protein [Clostridium paridis]|uniref:Helix-turn-helix transcriptional regulator n=1 Tax=Clostridium paridis TaxID=2803863 RepID=A0A937K451_9CLOT|nr:helix-turn-helix transcriptional regulator [Clostridium paridis]MBL4932292.1 helix-turn-helix transcriptional regulator [Clostridium paridis]